MPCVLQSWVCNLTFMQQSVLLTAMRGPDGVHKNHISKKLLRWLRRCVLISAFDGKTLPLPYDVLGEPQGGSFTGPSMPAYIGTGPIPDWEKAMHEVLDEYMLATDMIPHHFQLHFLHAAEILGMTHPNVHIKNWWYRAYYRLCNDMHLRPEEMAEMKKRLGDNKGAWRAREEVTAD